MSEMKKVILAAALFGIVLGGAVFFSSISVAETPHVMLQNTVLPQAKTEAVSVRTNQSDWSTAIGFLIGGLVGFGSFLVAKRRG
jgi:hypothetical protein